MDLTLSPTWAIELATTNPLARFAAEELRRTLQRIGAPALPIVDHANGPRIAMRHRDAGDGFLRAQDSQGLLLRGESPRGLLYAVYDLLDSIGCRWVVPGPDGERLPRYTRVLLPAAGSADRPALPGRCLVLGHDLFLAEAEPWIIWAARNRLNTIFVHTIGRGLPFGACRLGSWATRRRALLPLMRERGLDLELGGHHLSDLVPRRLFRTQPDLFRYDGAQRTPDRNFCPSNPQTHALLRANGAIFFQTYPEAAVYHLWPDDLLGGGWCSCARCVGLTPADQALLATNTLAAVLAALRPDARLSYLAYHDTEAPPARVAPLPNVKLCFAPRPRSYAHGIGSALNPINAVYAARLAANMALFASEPTRPELPGVSFAAKEMSSAPAQPSSSVFEYYLDGVLFKSALPPLPTVIAADMLHYRESGVQMVQALMTGDRPWRAAPINAWLFARLAWNPDQSPEELVVAYAAARAPREPAALARAYVALEAAWYPALDRVPAEDALRSELGELRDLVATPPADLLDYMAAPRPYNERRLEQLHGVENQIAVGRAAWQSVLATAFADRPMLAAEQAEWELGAALLRFITLRQQLYVLADRAAPRVTLRAALGEAQTALDSLIGLGEIGLPPRARPGYYLLRAIFQLQLDSIFDRALALPWQRVGLRGRRAAVLIWRYARAR